jgi:glutamyl/glutaminyl-tRNA synthetase
LTVTVDAKKILEDTLSYDFDALIASVDSPVPVVSIADNATSNTSTAAHEHSLADLLKDDFEGVVRQLVKDYDDKVFPDSSHPDFATQWKDYIKKLSVALNRKGKRVFHPVRVALTGRWAGPDVGAQLHILAKAQPLLVTGTPIVPLEKRFEILRRFLESKTK